MYDQDNQLITVREIVFLDKIKIKNHLIKQRYIQVQIFRQVEIYLHFRMVKFPNQPKIIMYKKFCF